MSSKLTTRKSALMAIIATALIAIAGFTGSATAAQRICDDGTHPPCDGGGGGNEPPDYGDLIILYRDASGVPILDGNQCQQPIAFPSDMCALDCTGQDPCLVEVEETTCAVAPSDASCTQEVEFGRINEARTTESVFASQLEDVVVNLAIADCVTLDPAGRLVASRVVDEETVLTSTIDSPLQNLAIYRQLMLTGDLGAPLPEGVDILGTAARGLGVASDKGGEVNVDMVAYLNFMMGLSDPATPTILDKLCIDVKEEVMGTVQLVQKCFLDYGNYPPDDPLSGNARTYPHTNNVAAPAAALNGTGFAYQRTENFVALPAPPYIDDPSGSGQTDIAGWFEYLAQIPGYDDPPWFEIKQGPIMNAVFPNGNGGNPGFTGGNIGGFAQAADDTRAVINYMHNWPVPGDFPTPVPCEASGDINYDVSISEESGLQVPTRMVATAEDREFVVTVANAGPQAATGHVTLTAAAAAGGPVNGSPWTLEFTDLAAGANTSWTEIFTIAEPHLRTTINWTATIVAVDDVNELNNSVTATTKVKVTGVSGGGKP